MNKRYLHPLVRVSYDLILFLTVYLFPVWLSLIIAIIGLFLFKHFVEAVFAGVILDLLYRSGGNVLLGNYLHTIIGLGLYGLSIVLKDRLRI